MNHPELSALLDLGLGISTESEDPLARAHLKECDACTDELNQMLERQEDLRRYYAALTIPSTEGVESRVMRAFRSSTAKSSPQPRSPRRFTVVAASLAMCAAVWWLIIAPPANPGRTTSPFEDEILRELRRITSGDLVERDRAARELVRKGVEAIPILRKELGHASGPSGELLKEIIARIQATPDEVAGRINGEILTWKDVKESLKDIKPEDVTPELFRAKRRELAELILIRQFAERKHITVSEAEVDQAVQRDLAKYGSPEEYQKIIRIRYGTLSKYREGRRCMLLAFKTLDYAFRSQKSDPDFMDAGFLPVSVPQESLRKYFESTPEQFQATERISFMRIGLQFSSPAEETTKRAIAESLLRKLEEGAEFALLVSSYSDVRRAKDYCDMGVSRKDLEGIYAPETITYLFDVMKEGEASPVVKDGSTLNIFEMLQKIKQKEESLGEAQVKIRNMLENGVHQKNLSKFIQLLVRSAQLEPTNLFEEK
jgi:hypothetical protein